MLQMRHRRTDVTGSDRRLRRGAISFIIFVSCDARQGLLRRMTAVLADRACNETGAELLIEDSRTESSPQGREMDSGRRQ
jgi:hypothetical protein